jgi:hypothetical protein
MTRITAALFIENRAVIYFLPQRPRIKRNRIRAERLNAVHGRIRPHSVEVLPFCH